MTNQGKPYQPSENGYINIVQHRGTLEQELDDEVKRVVQHIRRTGGKAKLTLTLNFTKLDFEGGIGIGHDMKVTLPKDKSVQETLMWADRDGGLRDHAQDQNDLFGKDDKPALKQAEAGTVSPLRSA